MTPAPPVPASWYGLCGRCFIRFGPGDLIRNVDLVWVCDQCAKEKR